MENNKNKNNTLSLWTWKRCRECGKKFRIPKTVNEKETVFYCSESCRKKAAKPFLEARNENLQALGEAVIRRACTDYVFLRKKKESGEMTEEDGEEFLELQDFFLNRMNVFCPEMDLNGEYLLKQLNSCDKVLTAANHPAFARL